MVNITSTVMPGSTGGEIRAGARGDLGPDVGKDLGLCYNPEFIALGSVVRDMLLPDVILIGESDPQGRRRARGHLRSSCDNKPTVQRMNFINAELAKISVNAFVTTKISYANMLADICDRLPGADVDVVTNAIGRGQPHRQEVPARGALGYGGPCFPRDNVAFSHLRASIGAHAGPC